MPTLISKPTIIPPAGHPPKLIREHVGRVNTGDSELSIAHMKSPPGWSEPGQRPDFKEFTVVLQGQMVVDYHDDTNQLREMVVEAGQTVITEAGEWIRYRTPKGAEYIAICSPAFSLQAVHRDPQS
ncbi:MAG: cupin [Myxococcales bacterium]|nr:cupin [Myxococcales bacterium]